MREYNSQYFSKEQVESGSASAFIKMLMDMCYEDNNPSYNDIHIQPEDCGAFTVQWIQVPWDHDYGGTFQYVDEDHVVARECEFPDKSFHLFYDDEDAELEFNQWLEEHPEYKKDAGGHWINDQEE